MSDLCVGCKKRADEGFIWASKPHCEHCHDVHLQFLDDNCYCDGSGQVYGEPPDYPI